MPLFRLQKEKTFLWIPVSAIHLMEDAPGGLTTLLTATMLTPKGPAIAHLEVEGRCETHAAALDGTLRPLLETH